MSGGVGDLRDGVIAAQNWNLVEGPPGPNGPYVGWNGIDPVITFSFDRDHAFSAVFFHFDGSNGTGGVFPPSKITVGREAFAITNPSSGTPFAFTAMRGAPPVTDPLAVQIFRGAGPGIFLSEVEFSAESVGVISVPAALPLLLSDLAGLGLCLRRRRESVALGGCACA